MKKRLLSILLTIIAVFAFNISVFAGPAGGYIVPKNEEITIPDTDCVKAFGGPAGGAIHP